MTPPMSTPALLMLALLTACPPGAETGGSQPQDTDTDTDSDTTPIVGLVDTGLVFLDACKIYNSVCDTSDNPNCGACQYQVKFDGDRCQPGRPCTDLLIYLAAASCNVPGLQTLLDDIVSTQPNTLVACVQPNFPGEMVPTSIGAPQREAIVIPHVLELLQSDATLGAWTGENLLFAGCSQSASRFPVVSGRYPNDANWLATGKTGACMADGVVDIPYQDRFVGERMATDPACRGRHRRVAQAYTVRPPVPGHACTASPQAQCACDPAHASLLYTGDCDGGDCVAFDSIVGETADGFAFSPGVAASDFAVAHWKIITEGSAWADTDLRCDNDVVPAPPFEGFCSALDADPAHDCVYEAHPDAPHCSYMQEHFNDACLTWFQGLP